MAVLRHHGRVEARGDAALQQLLIDRFEEIGDRSTAGTTCANRDGWWQDAQILERLPAALAEPFRPRDPTVVVGPQSSGFLLGPLVARELGVGFVAARKEIDLLADSDAWIRATTPPDCRDRHLEFGFRRGTVTAADRVLIIDDWADTGSELQALRTLAERAEARVVGTAVIADGLTDNRIRRRLQLTSLLHARELWH